MEYRQRSFDVFGQFAAVPIRPLRAVGNPGRLTQALVAGLYVSTVSSEVVPSADPPIA
jgi:hypothetical protein